MLGSIKFSNKGIIDSQIEFTLSRILALHTGTGNWAMHLDGFSRNGEDFRAGNGETINNTSTDSQGVKAGLNYIQENGNAHGIALSE